MPGLKDFNRRMNAIPKAVREAVKPALERSADELVQTMRHLAPVDDEDGGQLKASIRKEAGDHELAVTVKAGGPLTTRPVRDGASATYDYAMAQEFGTAKMEANPYFWPAVRLTRKKIRNRLRRAVAKAVKDSMK